VDWTAPILKAAAATGDGIDGVVAAIAEHLTWLEAGAELAARRQRRAATEIEAIALGEVRQQFGQVHGSAALAEAAARVVAGTSDPYTAAAALVAAL
jgi:LAO/AO transport system kinase